MLAGGGGGKDKTLTTWATVEHFYQAQKFTHDSASSSSPLSAAALEASKALVEAIRAAPTPVDAASLGRAAQRSSPELVRADWEEAKLDVMICGLRAKFSQHADVRESLLATDPRHIAEASPSDHFWGLGVDGSGCNHLGRLLAEVRAEVPPLSSKEEEEGDRERDGAVVNGHHHHRPEQQQQEQQPSKTTPVVR